MPLATAADGMVFDIQRFSVHDGPGIRTTVFLKGCPLRCQWCHNPESWSPDPELSYRADLCLDCLDCVAVCPTGAQQATDGVHVLDHEACQACGDCVDVCSQGALRVIGGRMSVDEVMAEVLRDGAYYASSGGGLTLSGGEPLAQAEFAWALLRAAKRHGLHTCLDTSGYAPAETLRAVAGDVDLFLWDYKATGEEKHRELTGVEGEPILANLDWLMAHGARVALRCPMIPGVNDAPEHLAAIAALSARYPELEAVDVLPYHALARHKAEQIGFHAPLGDLPSADEQTIAGWLDELHRLGCARTAWMTDTRIRRADGAARRCCVV